MQTLYVREKEKKSIVGQHILTQSNLPIPSPPPPPPLLTPKRLKSQLTGHLVSTKRKTNNKDKN